MGGAHFIGQGGNCKGISNQTVYGQYNMVPPSDTMNSAYIEDYKDQLGSVGKLGDAETAGGGRITLIAESLVLKGFGVPISANAKPYETFTAPYKEPGGSGGYIYIKTHNSKLPNEVNGDVRIEAKGGFGINGGSGGVIIFDNSFSLPEE